MVGMKNKAILFLSLIFTLFLLGFISACNYCGDGVINQQTEECDYGSSNGLLCWAGYGSSCTYCTSSCKLKTITNYCGDGIKQECEECDDGNSIDTDNCSNLCKINNPEPPEPTCDHDIGIRYSYSNSFGTGIAVGYENGTWIAGNPVNLSEGNYKIKYFIDNKKEADDNVHIIVKVDNNNLIPEYNYEINSYHSKEISLNTSQLCGLHTISVNITSDGDECDKTDNYASRQIYINCFIEPPAPVCGNSILETGEQCDDGNLVNGDGCSNICKTENNNKHEKHFAGSHFVQFCDVNWACSGWSECNENGFMTRQCYDRNNCEQQYNKPAQISACELQKVLIKEKENNILLWVMIGTSLLLLFILIFLARFKGG
jgi:cysteine-rich repeat protein